MIKRLFTLVFALAMTGIVVAQNDWNNNYNEVNNEGKVSKRGNADSLGTDKQVPIGQYVWTVNRKFGDVIPSQPDTVLHMFMNDGMVYGLRGEYVYTGNEGSPRIHRIFVDRDEPEQNIFAQNYDYFITAPDKLHFINTLSPITNISFFSNGNSNDGTDRIRAIFAVNANKRLGVGFKLDYDYARGYYTNTNSSQFGATLFGSYLGEKYQMHAILSTNRQKQAESGGITNDSYITHPESITESFSADEIPSVLEKNWNRNANQHVFFTQRYSLGFYRREKMTEAEIKAKKFAVESQKSNAEEEKKKGENNKDRGMKKGDRKGEMKAPAGRPDDAKIAQGNMPGSKEKASERITVDSKAKSDSMIAEKKKAEFDTMTMKNVFVPVTSFIHTMELDNYDHIFEAYQTPDNYYANTYYKSTKLGGDSIYDETKHFDLKNTFAIALLEGFNKYAKAGLKVFATHEMRHFSLPDSTGTRLGYNEHNISVGGMLSKTLGKTFHYNVMGEAFLIGEDSKQLKLDGWGEINVPLFKDTVNISGHAFIHSLNPTFYYRHYHGQHIWWDNNNMDKETRTRIEGTLSLERTKTKLRIAVEEVKNYAYFSQYYNVDSTSYARTANSVSVKQASGNINILTAQLEQNFAFGPFRWENQITYQSSSNNDVIPLPKFNLYSNLYLDFMVAKVLHVNMGADVRLFSKYYAPDYSPALNQYTVQSPDMNRMEVGMYPIVNAYANLQLKHTRFFVMMSHVNCGSGNSQYFMSPHYPVNPMVLHLGVSWNFYN